MVFGWVRKLFKKKKGRTSTVGKQPVALVRAHTFHTSNVPPTAPNMHEQSQFASPISSRVAARKSRRSLRKRVAPQAQTVRVHNLDDSDGEASSFEDENLNGAWGRDVVDSCCRGPRVVHTPSRIATLTKRDYQRIFNHQFDVSKIPEVKVPTWKTSRPYEQQAAHFKFRMSGRFYESDASTIHGGAGGLPPVKPGYEGNQGPNCRSDYVIHCATEPLGRFKDSKPFPEHIMPFRQSDVLFDDSQSAVEVVEEGDLPSSPEVSTYSL
uniref:HDNR domain-containing protein n=1 Tax=Panagrellus redivivus TaxID=6233 RepID=A0A7E4VM99_PANRE